MKYTWTENADTYLPLPASHVWTRGRFTGAMTCERCGLLPLDEDDTATMCGEGLREQFIAEAEKSRWKPANGKHAFSPALALRDVVIPLVRDLGVNVHEVAYSQGWTMREDNYLLEPYKFDHMIYATILGVRDSVNELRFYALDTGTEIVPLLLVDGREAP